MKPKDREYGFQARGLTPALRNDSKRICVAQIGAPHGVQGEVRIKSFTAEPNALARYGVLTSQDGTRSFEIEALRTSNEILIGRLKGVADRAAAETLRNLRLYVPRDRLPAPDEDEFYHADLIGLAAIRPDGVVIGTVAALHDFGAGDLIEIAPETGGSSLLLPFTRAMVPEVDVAGGRVVVELPQETEDEPQTSSPPLRGRSRRLSR